jgi:hypothetical protein
MKDFLLNCLLYTALAVLVASLALNVEGWLLDYFLNLPR